MCIDLVSRSIIYDINQSQLLMSLAKLQPKQAYETVYGINWKFLNYMCTTRNLGGM